MTSRFLGEHEDTAEVEGDGVVELLSAPLAEQKALAAAGGVDEDIDVAEFPDGGRDQIEAFTFVADVGLAGQSMPPEMA